MNFSNKWTIQHSFSRPVHHSEQPEKPSILTNEAFDHIEKFMQWVEGQPIYNKSDVLMQIFSLTQFARNQQFKNYSHQSTLRFQFIFIFVLVFISVLFLSIVLLFVILFNISINNKLKKQKTFCLYSRVHFSLK